MDRPYAVLGLEPDADRDRVRSVYRSLLKEHHPDQGGSTEAFLRIKRAYETIQNRQARTSTSGSEMSKTATTDGGTTTRSQNLNWRLSGDDVERTDATSRPCSAGVGLELDGDALTLRLVSFATDVDLTGMTWNTDDTEPRRPVAWFIVENTSDRQLRWRGNYRTTFVGSDGEEYEPSGSLRASTTLLPADWTGSSVELDPGDVIRTVVVCEQLPPSETVDRIRYSQPVGGPARVDASTSKERFVFDIEATERTLLSEQPF